MKKVAATRGHKVSFGDFFRREDGREMGVVIGRCSSVELVNSYGCLLWQIKNFDPGKKEYSQLDYRWGKNMQEVAYFFSTGRVPDGARDRKILSTIEERCL